MNRRKMASMEAVPVRIAVAYLIIWSNAPKCVESDATAVEPVPQMA